MIIEGTLLEPLKISGEIARLRVRVHRIFMKEKTMRVKEDVMVTVYDNIINHLPGDKLRFPARLRSLKNFNNPGRYDYVEAMKLKGISCSASVTDGRRIVPMGQGSLPFPRGLLESIQRPVRNFFAEKLKYREYALYRALILGERQGIAFELRELFNRTGMGHVLAVSGLHIGLVAWISFFIFRGVLSRSYRLTLRIDIRKTPALLTCLPVIIYTCLAGMQVSSQRAMIMALAFLVSIILGRERDVWSTLALAALVILAIDPYALYSISFQLSFTAVVGILWLSPPLLNRIPGIKSVEAGKSRIIDRVLQYFIGLVIVSLCAVVFLFPITSFYFHRVSLVTIPANVTVVPLLGLWIIPLGLLSALTLPFSSGLAGVFLWLGELGIKKMMTLIEFWAHLDWSDFWIFTPNLFEIIVFYVLIFLVVSFKRGAWAKWALLSVIIVCLADAGYWVHRVNFNSDLRVTFLDVGQGNSALVEFPGGKKMLIDGGGFTRSSFDVGRMVVAPCLWSYRISSIAVSYTHLRAHET